MEESLSIYGFKKAWGIICYDGKNDRLRSRRSAYRFAKNMNYSNSIKHWIMRQRSTIISRKWSQGRNIKDVCLMVKSSKH